MFSNLKLKNEKEGSILNIKWYINSDGLGTGNKTIFKKWDILNCLHVHNWCQLQISKLVKVPHV